MKRLILLNLIVLMSLSAAAENVHFAYKPSLSPDGKDIYFSYDGDIYKVPVTGGTALSIVSMAGNENNPVVSPDGKYLAFSSDIQGNNDVYVVPTAGGDIRQLTFNEAGDTPASWSPDSRYIYFETTRASARKTTFRVSIDGGTPELLFDGYFNTIVNVVENPKTGEYLFNESNESISFPTRKRYVGDHNPNIKSWNPKSNDYKELTDYEGKDQWPMVDKNGNIYYVSDAKNKESNIVKYVKNGEHQWLTSFDKSIQYPSLAFDGSAMVFVKEYEINVLNLSSGQVSVPQIAISNHTVEIKRQFADQKPSAAAISPDGKKFALVIRGQLYISDAKCKYLQKLDTPLNERVGEVVWNKDNKTVYYTRTNHGWTDIYKIAADGSAKEQSVWVTPNNSKGLSVSHKADKIAFVDGSHSLMLLDMGTDTVEKIADAEFWSYQTHAVAFSYDGNYIAFEAIHMFEPDVYIYSLKDRTVKNLTNSASTDGEMVFSPDGKYMYLLSNPTGTSYPRGTETSLFKLSLQKYDKEFKSDVYDKLFTEDKKDEVVNDGKKTAGKSGSKKGKADSADAGKSVKEKKDSTVTIDYKDVYRRMTQVDANGSQYGLYMFATKDKSLLFYSSYSENGMKMYALDINDPEAKPKEVKDVRGGSFTSTDKDLYLLSSGSIYKIDPNSLNTTKTDVSMNVEKVLADEFEQMLYEGWGALEQNYYDVNFHSADWYAVRDYYASFLPYVRTRENLRTLMADMLGELNSSHQGFTSSGSEEKPVNTVHTYQTGVVFNAQSPYTVEKIIAESPADKFGIDIRKGDELVAVDGTRIDPDENREKYFTSPVAKDELKLTFSRDGKEFDVKLHTTSLSALKTLMYLEWENERKDMVEQKSEGRIGYIHMRAMGDEDLEDFLLRMHTDVYDKDALILDLRYNNGGNVHNEVIEFLSQKRYFDWAYRDFPTTTHPNVVPAGKPIVVLVNEHSLSDAEVTSNGIQTLGIAKLVGTETYRWIIFTSSVRLLDGSSVRMPAWGCYNIKGEDLEFAGVKPDIYVKNTFKDRLEGNDPQLDAAIAEVLKELK